MTSTAYFCFLWNKTSVSIDWVLQKQNLYKLHLKGTSCLSAIHYSWSGHFRSYWCLGSHNWTGATQTHLFWICLGLSINAAHVCSLYKVMVGLMIVFVVAQQKYPPGGSPAVHGCKNTLNTFTASLTNSMIWVSSNLSPGHASPQNHKKQTRTYVRLIKWSLFLDLWFIFVISSHYFCAEI